MLRLHSRLAERSAELQLGVVEDVTLATLAEFRSLSGGSSGEAGVSTVVTPVRSWAGSADGIPSEPDLEFKGAGAGNSNPSPPGNRTLYRFDNAHPPVGGKIKAALDQQRTRLAPRQSTGGIESLTSTPGASAGRSPSLSAAALSAPPATNKTNAADQPAQREPLAFPLPNQRPTPTTPSSAKSEYAIQPIPRSFLLPAAPNRWPGRLCLLAGALFIAGQSWLLWSFLRGEALGVAGGILASAWAFAMALYLIARYCDEDLERQ